MNKEEIETLLNKCDNCKITDIQKIKEYVRNLEITNEELDKECSRLEEKDFRLDKVTKYIENYLDDQQNEYEARSESDICQTDEDEHIKEKELAIIKGQKQVLKNVLNIIEGGKK